jgi:hypothetical protein
LKSCGQRGQRSRRCDESVRVGFGPAGTNGICSSSDSNGRREVRQRSPLSRSRPIDIIPSPSSINYENTSSTKNNIDYNFKSKTTDAMVTRARRRPLPTNSSLHRSNLPASNANYSLNGSIMNPDIDRSTDIQPRQQADALLSTLHGLEPGAKRALATQLRDSLEEMLK